MSTDTASARNDALASVGDALAMIVSTREDEPIFLAAAKLATAHGATVSALLFERARSRAKRRRAMPGYGCSRQTFRGRSRATR